MRRVEYAAEVFHPAVWKMETETHRFFEGHEITIIERLRIKEDKKLLSYSGQIGGPNRQYPFEFDFEIG
jgi:hypothetical protein